LVFPVSSFIIFCRSLTPYLSLRYDTFSFLFVDEVFSFLFREPERLNLALLFELTLFLVMEFLVTEFVSDLEADFISFDFTLVTDWVFLIGIFPSGSPRVPFLGDGELNWLAC